MNNNKEYLKLVELARKNQLKLLKKDYITIRNIYKDASQSLLLKATKANAGTLTERFLTDYRKQIDITINEINKQLSKTIKADMLQSAQLATGIQTSFFDLLDDKFSIGLDNRFSSVFSKTPDNVISHLMSGKFYKDGLGLSQRIWFTNQKVNGDIDYIIKQAIVEKKSAFELAKDLETYVNPSAAKSFEWRKVYPNAGNKQIDYNAQRLARTSINHSYFLSNVDSCNKNPYVEAMHWKLSNSHYSRQVQPFGEDICDEYANQDNYGLGKGNYPKDQLPLPHPNCLCTQYPVIPKSLEQIATELKDYIDNGGNKDIDEFIKSKSSKSDIINLTTDPYKQLIPHITNDFAQGLYNTHQDVLQHGLTTGNEKLALINMAGKQVIKAITGTHNEIALTPDFINYLNNADAESVTMVHNHPSSSCFSSTDLNLINKYDSIKYMTVEGHDGTKYMVNNNGNKIPAKDLINKYNNYNKKYFDYFNNQVVDQKLNRKIAWKEHTHYILTDLTKDIGWSYNRVITDEYKPIAEKIAKGLKKEGLIK
jgi:hypothetical protein